MFKTTRGQILVYLCITYLISCISNAFSKEEKDFVYTLSSLLEGATITIKKADAINTDSGTFKKFEIVITNLKIDSNRIETQTLFASSVPALLLLKSKIPRLSDYKFVDVKIRNERSPEINIRYETSELYQVEACMRVFNGYIYGLQHLNEDSLAYYSDPGLLDKFPIDKFISTISDMEISYGKPKDVNFRGFKIGLYDGERAFLYATYLVREKGDNLVEIGINPTTKKVIYFSL